MSDERTEPDPSASEPDVDDLDDLDDLDGDGFDRELASARDAAIDKDPDDGRPLTEREAGLRGKVGWGRSPIISAAVVVVGLFLLVATWSDFIYFTKIVQGAPKDLGTVSDVYEDGEFSQRLDNQWVHIEGEPDVQHAARMQTRDRWIGFMRLLGADAALFVGVPRTTQNVDQEYPGEFTGRMIRVDQAPQWEKLEVFFRAEELVEIVDLDPRSVTAAIAKGGTSVGTLAGGETTLEGDEPVRVIVGMPVGIAQLGRNTWKTRAEAEAAMAALGRPYAFVEKRPMVWVFAIQVGRDAEVEVFQTLTRTLNGGDDLVGADPKVGALVLPRRATYLTTAGDLEVDGDQLSFTYGNNTAGPGWRVDGDALTPIDLVGGRLAVSTAAIEEIRVERRLDIDPDGYLLMVDQAPADVWPSAVMFIVVLGVVLLNAWALVATLRRRRERAQPA